MLLATFQNGFRDKTTPTLITPLVRANMSCAVATIFSSLDFLSLSISMAKLSSLVAATFSSLALHSFSVSTANLSCSLSTTFSSFRFLSNSLSSPRFNILRVGGRCGFLFSYIRILSSAFLSSSLCSSVFFNDGSNDYVIQKAVTKTIRMLSV